MITFVFISERLNDVPVNREDSLEAAVKSIGSSTGQNFIKQTLITIREAVTCQDGACPKVIILLNNFFFYFQKTSFCLLVKI